MGWWAHRLGHICGFLHFIRELVTAPFSFDFGTGPPSWCFLCSPMCLTGFCWIRLVIAPSSPARCFFGNHPSVMKSTNSFFFYIYFLTPLFPLSSLFLFSFFTKKGSRKEGLVLKDLENESFAKPPRGKMFGKWSFTKLPEGKKCFTKNPEGEKWST